MKITISKVDSTLHSPVIPNTPISKQDLGKKGPI